MEAFMNKSIIVWIYCKTSSYFLTFTTYLIERKPYWTSITDSNSLRIWLYEERTLSNPLGSLCSDLILMHNFILSLLELIHYYFRRVLSASTYQLLHSLMFSSTMLASFNMEDLYFVSVWIERIWVIVLCNLIIYS